jgi:dTDP-4-amino-4,6-dideoxygalactose transaminase
VNPASRPIPLFKVFMPRGVMAPLRRTLFSGYIGEGPRVAEFEGQLRPWLGSRNVLALNNGTAAIQLALRLAGVGPGTEVISTAMTCAATNLPILALGGRVVWADIDPWTGSLDPADVARKLTRRTRAVLCVHWGGYPCDLAELRAVARSRGVALVQDACHAFGSTYRGRPVGGESDFACFSFQAIKQMTTVDGGALTCRRRADHERGKLLRWYGIDRTVRPGKDLRCEDDIAEFGYKFHMNDVAATIGIEQLRHVGRTIELHRAHAAAYDEAFRGLAAARPLRYTPDRASARWLYSLRVRDRARFMRHMAGRGIGVSQVHARNDLHSVFRASRVPLPGVDEFSAEQVAIPVGWWLGRRDVARVIAAVRAYDRDLARG